MIRLVTTYDVFEAKLLAARLGSEGVLWELRGGVDNAYPLGPVHVYVDEADLPTARDVLQPLSDEDPAEAAATPLRTPFALIATLLVLGLLVAASLARLVAAAGH